MKIYKWLIKIPVIGMALAITNNYVAGGDFSADDRFAPLGCWLVALWVNVGVSVLMTVAVLLPYCGMIEAATCVIPKEAFAASPGSAAISILPNVLGFGIGVYALIFALSERFVKMFHDKAREANARGEKISVLTLNADMAFPLLVIVIAITCGLAQQVFKDTFWLLSVSWFLIWFSLIETAGLIGVIFRLGEQALLDKLDDPQ